MSAAKDGGAAFPEAIAVGPAGDVYPGYSGMTLRDWFAGNFAPHMATALAKANRDEGNRQADIAGITAALAYEYADAMLAERSKP